MANLIIVCGPQAVGKMTVAESIRDKIKYNLSASDAAEHSPSFSTLSFYHQAFFQTISSG